MIKTATSALKSLADTAKIPACLDITPLHQPSQIMRLNVSNVAGISARWPTANSLLRVLKSVLCHHKLVRIVTSGALKSGTLGQLVS